MVAGVDVWKHRAIIGVCRALSEASAFHRNSVGAYAASGSANGASSPSTTSRRATTRDATVQTPLSQYLAGHTQLFFAPVEWLVTSLAAEHLVVDAAQQTQVYRLTPGVQARISDNLTLIVNMREAFTGVTAGRARTFSVQLAVKSFPVIMEVACPSSFATQSSSRRQRRRYRRTNPGGGCLQSERR